MKLSQLVEQHWGLRTAKHAEAGMQMKCQLHVLTLCWDLVHFVPFAGGVVKQHVYCSALPVLLHSLFHTAYCSAYCSTYCSTARHFNLATFWFLVFHLSPRLAIKTRDFQTSVSSILHHSQQWDIIIYQTAAAHGDRADISACRWIQELWHVQ